MTKKEWVRQESRSPLHWAAAAGLFLLLAAGLMGIFYGWVYYALFGLFFLITSWPFLKMMILITAVLSLLVFLFPVLAPFMLLLMVIFFLLRIRFVVHNWRPLLMGLLVYGIGLSLPRWDWIVWLFSDSFERPVAASLILAGILAVLLHRGLCWLYGKGYSAQSALGLMGSVPLFIIAFLLPFLKIAGMEGAFGEPAVFHDAPGDAVPHSPIDPMPRPVPQGLPDTVAPLHYVEPHVRMTGSGPVSVAGHFQTNPDGLLINNLGEQGISLTDGTRAVPSGGSGTVIHEGPVQTAAAEAAEHIYPGDAEAGEKRREEQDREGASPEKD